MRQNRRDFVRTLFVATQAALASRYLPGNLLAAEAEQPVYTKGFNFLIFGDWGRKGERNQKDVARQMGIAAKAADPRFVVSVGDNFYDYGVTSITDPQWHSSFEDVYNTPALQIPWHAILGNHDYNGNCDAQVAYTSPHTRWNMPARYFSQTHHIDEKTSADFFYLDTSPMIAGYWHGHGNLSKHVSTQDVPKQIEWFKSSIAASNARWKVVIGHHPIYSGGDHGDSPDLIKKILPILKENNVHAYFNGHDHDLQHLVTGDLNMFCTGAGSLVRVPKKTPRTQFAVGQPGFTCVSLHSDKMSIQMINGRGEMLHKAEFS